MEMEKGKGPTGGPATSLATGKPPGIPTKPDGTFNGLDVHGGVEKLGGGRLDPSAGRYGGGMASERDGKYGGV